MLSTPPYVNGKKRLVFVSRSEPLNPHTWNLSLDEEGTVFTYILHVSVIFLLVHHLYIFYHSRCWSNGIGRNGNRKQTINLDPGCWGKGTVVHEIGEFKCHPHFISLPFSLNSYFCEISALRSNH